MNEAGLILFAEGLAFSSIESDDVQGLLYTVHEGMFRAGMGTTWIGSVNSAPIPSISNSPPAAVPPAMGAAQRKWCVTRIPRFHFAD